MHISNFYYGVVTNSKGVKKFLACDEHSGGYPYTTTSPQIFYDTKYLEAHRGNDRLIEDGKYTLNIFEVNPINNTVTEVK